MFSAQSAPPLLPEQPHALVLTADPVLLEDVLRLAAAGGCATDVVGDGGAARRAWAVARLVLIGGDLAQHVAGFVRSGALPRRAGVVVVTADLDDAGVWQRAVAVGAEYVACLPDAEPWLLQRLAASTDKPDWRGAAVAVIGGCGGAGATVLATGLALAAVRGGLRTMLVDADPLGGGIDLGVGAERDPRLRRADLSGTSARLSAGALPPAPPRLGLLTVLSWDRPDVAGAGAGPGAMTTLLTAAVSSTDFVVIDLPRRIDETARAAVAATQRVLLVVPAEVRACAAASRVLAGVREDCADVGIVVQRGAGGLPDHAVAKALSLPLVGSLQPEPGLAASRERGEPPGWGPGPLARLCERLVAETLARPVGPGSPPARR